MNAQTDIIILKPKFSDSLSKEQGGRLTHTLNILINGFNCETGYALQVAVDDHKNAHPRFYLLGRAKVYKEKADILLSALKLLQAIDEEEYARLSALFVVEGLKI